ncbi:MAG: acetate kinase, partial [bacterium]|nr:acetate kinase [bacterium]
SFFNSRCGLLGLSGKTADVRELIELEKAGDEGARLALESFSTQVKKYIGAFAAELGGLDLLVFAATIGERSFLMRERICAGLEGLGMALDRGKNSSIVSTEGLIHADASPVKIAVIPTDELAEIARETRELS